MLNEDLSQHKEEQNPVEELTEKITDWYNEQQEQMIIDDIIACYNGNLCNYELYVEKRNAKVMKDFHGLTVNVQPLVLSKTAFEYARAKGLKK